MSDVAAKKQAARAMYGVCGARLPKGGICTNPKGWGTDHLGKGRCYLHTSEKPRGSYTARYLALISDPRLHDLAEEIYRTLEPADLQADLAVLRAMYVTAASEGEYRLARQLADSIVKMASTLHSIEEGRLQRIHVQQVAKLIQITVRTALEFVPPDLQDQFLRSVRDTMATEAIGVLNQPAGVIDEEASDLALEIPKDAANSQMGEQTKESSQ